MEIRRTYPDPSWDGAGPVAGGLQGRYRSVANPSVPLYGTREGKGLRLKCGCGLVSRVF